jgi:site-specific recombinase XerD
MSALAPVMEGFFTEQLIGQRQASAHTVASYRDTFRLLLGFAQRQTGKAPSKLTLEDLDAVLVGAFLDHLERERHNSVRTRNNRLAAIHSLFSYAALRHPEHAALIQRVLAIPTKRMDRKLVSFLTDDEVHALLAAPDRDNWIGRRDHVLLVVAIQTGLRVSELTSLTCSDVELGTGAHVRCHGKGRKERITPLTTEVCAVLRVWLAERHGDMHDAVFPSRRGGPLSSDAVAVLVARHAHTAASRCPSLLTKTVTPHVLRHTCAMRLLAVGVDTSVIALWLGHESVETTQIYLHADLAIKERALARTAPTGTPPGRYRPPDELLAFLESL